MQNRVILDKFSIILRNADYASFVIASASSSIIILNCISLF